MGAIGENKCRGLQIRTFGSFLVSSGDERYSSRAQRSNKLWQLFKYFLTNRGKLVSPYSVINDLWPNTENADPIAALQDLVYRLRQLFSDVTTESGDPMINIEFSQGSYRFTLSSEVWLDVNEFLVLSQRASESRSTNTPKAIRMYLEAISLYEGDYLPGIYENWLLAPRQHYRRIFIQNLQEVVQLLRDSGDYDQIVQVCESVLLNENEWLLEAEQLHRHFLEALIRTGRTVEAFGHHQAVSDLLEREVGVSPPVSMQQLERWANSQTAGMHLDISTLVQHIRQDRQSAGAVLCDSDEFRLLCLLEGRRRERMQQSPMLGLFTIIRRGTVEPEASTLSRSIAGLKEVLATNLRSGDAITQWNDHQCLSLMCGFQSDGIDSFRSRIADEFDRRFGHYGTALQVKVQILTAE